MPMDECYNLQGRRWGLLEIHSFFSALLSHPFLIDVDIHADLPVCMWGKEMYICVYVCLSQQIMIIITVRRHTYVLMNS